MYLGIEIGGTKLQIGLGRGDGKLVDLWRARVEPKGGAAAIRRQIQKAAAAIISRAKKSAIQGIGVGFGGPIDDRTRSVLKSHQISGWENFPIARWLEKTFDVPVALGNDADVAGLAETLFGAGSGMSPVFYITVGSGIGGGLIIDGQIYRGSGRGAAEIGHLSLLAQDHERGEFEADLEDLASGWAIAQHAQTYVREDSLLWELCDAEPETITAEMVGEAAADGDEFALETIEYALQHLATSIGHVIALLAPKRIVIGGGVALLGDKLFFDPLRKLVARRAFAPFAKTTKIVPAALGEEVVVHGALALARQKLAE